ncbi:MAG: hypothetical protein ABIU18_04940 [Novosphingobium sp.]
MSSASPHSSSAHRFPHDYTFAAGELFCGKTPDQGMDIDKQLAANYPSKLAYLPVARLEDGTTWNG